MTDEMVGGFAVRTDFAYDLEHHMWVEVLGPGRVKVGMDALGLETSGTVAQLSFDVGRRFARGEPFGSLEAEKFVGPLVAPLSGRTLAVNQAVVADPGLAERDPYGEGWLIEMSPLQLDIELEDLVRDPEAIVAAFKEKIRRYRIEGVLAE